MNLDVSFRFKSSFDWFDNNYFLCIYDKNDNYLMSFDSIEETSKFFNKSVKRILFALRNNLGIVYNHKQCKLICIEKDKEEDLDIGSRF